MIAVLHFIRFAHIVKKNEKKQVKIEDVSRSIFRAALEGMKVNDAGGEISFFR